MRARTNIAIKSSTGPKRGVKERTTQHSRMKGAVIYTNQILSMDISLPSHICVVVF